LIIILIILDVSFFFFLTLTENWLFDTTTKLNFNQFVNIGIIPIKFYFHYFHQKYFTSKCNPKQRHNLNDDFFNKHPLFYLLWRLPKKMCSSTTNKITDRRAFLDILPFCFHFPPIFLLILINLKLYLLNVNNIIDNTSYSFHFKCKGACLFSYFQIILIFLQHKNCNCKL